MYAHSLSARPGFDQSGSFRSIHDQVDWIMQRLAESPAQTDYAGSAEWPSDPRFAPVAFHGGAADEYPQPPDIATPEPRSWRDVADNILARLEYEEARRAAVALGQSRWPEGSYDVAGGPTDRTEANPDATGPHSSFKRNPSETGPVTGYTTYWEKNPYTRKWERKVRYRGIGGPHFDSATRQYVNPPLIHEYDPRGSRFNPTTRPAIPQEIPRIPGIGGGPGPIKSVK